MLEQDIYYNEKGQSIIDRIDFEITENMSDVDYIKYCCKKNWNIGFTVIQGNDYKINLLENEELLFEIEKILLNSLSEDTINDYLKYRKEGMLNYFKSYRKDKEEKERLKLKIELEKIKQNLLRNKIKRFFVKHIFIFKQFLKKILIKILNKID